MNRAFVQRLLVEESFAYGFTIAFWGSGVLLVGEYGVLRTLGVLSYAVGAITGFGLLAVASFGGVFATATPDRSPRYVVLAGIHYLASLVPIVITHVLVAAPVGRLPSLFAAGINVSLSYNAFAALEEIVSEVVRAYERRYLE
ncbi:MAG: hypothetical protein ABEH78_11440 [Haloferacaceae archaeon]